ncbi:MAG: translation initiation factor IF-3 [Candidatus Nealsonbacteria bacterium]
MKRTYINNQIRAEKVRLIDETGQQMGILELEKAIQMAKDRGLDLIQVTEKTVPPVCKIMEYGKYLYQQKKKDQSAKQHQKAGEIKGIRLRFGISDHDSETKAKQAKKFLEKGDKVRIEMKLKGRERALSHFAEDKIKKFLEILEGLIPIKTEGELKKQPRGWTLIISKK